MAIEGAPDPEHPLNGDGCFPAQVEFITPRRTLAVSVTGERCALNCAHCGGHYLRGMTSLEEALAARRPGIKSFLISGGCDRGGRVPLDRNWAGLETLARQGDLNIHSGLVDEEEARAIGKIARVVSFDFVIDAEIIHTVYGLPATAEDYIRSYRYLRRYCRVVPHICIGIMGGRIKSEHRALQILKEEGAEAVSFIVFRPTPGTALAGCSPPLPEQVARVLAEARALFPRTPLSLGCMRPGGRHREDLDRLALGVGIDKIVQPAAAARELAAGIGLEVIRGEECCAL